MSRVLIVDDHKSTADSLAQIASRLGQDVKVLYEGNEALAEIDANPPELIVTDLRLPGASGIDILTHAMASHPDMVEIGRASCRERV